MTRQFSPAELLASLPEAERVRQLASLTPQTQADLLRYWPFWARPSQLAPAGDWLTWLFLAGRGTGKTRAGAEWTRESIKAGCGRFGLIAPTASDARDVMVEGESGLLACCSSRDYTYGGAPMGRPLYESSKRRVTWENGAQATLFSAEEAERLRGPQHDGMWADELAAWGGTGKTGRKRMQATWDMAMFGLRLGRRPRIMVTTTPKPVPLVKALLADPTTAVTVGSTFDNAANLAQSFLDKVVRDYRGTRLGRQELYAEILDDLPGALWKYDQFDECRVATVPELQRVVVAVDPSGGGDNIGIVVAGLGVDGRGYVLADRTCDLSPAGWGRRAVEAYYEFEADRLVAERNFGGDMVEHVIVTVDPHVSFKAVSASRGKVARAEPVAALYEQGRVSHVVGLNALEDQMCQMAPHGYEGEGSPDRVDALVWALTELMLGDQFSHVFA